MAVTTAYLSDLLGTPVRDPAGRVVGRVVDLFVPLEPDYPTVDALAVQTRAGTRTIAWEAVRAVDAATVSLGVPPEQTPSYDPQGALSLARQVLDRQIIDTNGVRVVRVNDLQFVSEGGRYRVVGIDVSAAGLLRRLGLDRPLAAVGIRPVPHTIAWQDVAPLESGAAGVRLRVAHEHLARLRPPDVAQILSQLDQGRGRAVLASLDEEAAAEALGEMDAPLQVALIKGLDAERAADILEEMDPDDAADLLGDLAEEEPERAEDLLGRMEAAEAADVRALLTYPDECAGGLMTTEFVAVPAELTVAAAIARVRSAAATLDVVYDVYVVDREGRLVGALSLRELIVAEPSAPLREVMDTDPVVGHLDDPAEEVARRIAKYNLLALPIVDDAGRLKGVVTVDDAMDVILPEDWKAHLPRVFGRG